MAVPERAPNFDEHAVDEILREMFGLSWEEMKWGVLARAQAAARPYESDLYPPGAAGQLRYIHLVAAYREIVLGRRWTKSKHSNIAWTISPDCDRAVVVTSGDDATAVPFDHIRRVPRTRYQKGEASRRLVRSNGQFALELEGIEDPVEQSESPTMRTWYLLSYVTPSWIRAELSVPEDVDDRGYVIGWGPRILLPWVANDGNGPDGTPLAVSPRTPSWTDDDENGIDIPVDDLMDG